MLDIRCRLIMLGTVVVHPDRLVFAAGALALTARSDNPPGRSGQIPLLVVRGENLPHAWEPGFSIPRRSITAAVEGTENQCVRLWSRT